MHTPGHYTGGHLTSSILRRREALLQQWARTQLEADGVEVYSQPFGASGAANTHAVVRGHRADGLEGLVLVTPLCAVPDGAAHAAALGLHLMRYGERERAKIWLAHTGGGLPTNHPSGGRR